MGPSAEPAGVSPVSTDVNTPSTPEGADAGLSGQTLRDMFAAATALLERNAAAINAINVFPVPDGDTGTNMHLTMVAAVEEAERLDGATADDVARVIAHGALMGARGNSGVILSQILRGLARGIEGRPHVDAGVLAAALDEASRAAYRAVSEPVEGTILTVMREAAEAARQSAGAGGGATDALARAAEAARQALARTPDLLPVLKEAGVVDAGGQGLCLILEAALAFLRGEAPAPEKIAAPGVKASWVAATEVLHREGEAPYGYCTEFLVRGPGLDGDAVRRRVVEMGTSVLVVGDDEVLRVHLHTTDPGAAISLGTSLGSLSHVKVENMEEQLQAFVESHQAPAPTEALAVGAVAVVPGAGLLAAFQSVGGCQAVSGGQTMNPSARSILEAIEACPAERVIVLPNNPNVILTARQAAEQSAKEVAVVPSRSVPQGVAALLALSQDLDLEGNVAAMTAAMSSVRSAEVTRAVRTTRVAGQPVAEGDAIGIVDGDLCVAEREVEDAVEACVRRMAWDGAGLLTLYYGEGVDEAQAQALARRLHDRYPSLEVEVVNGGQPHYPYFVSLE